MIFNGQTVGGLTVYFIDAITTWYYIAGLPSVSIIQNHTVWIIFNDQTVGGLTVYFIELFLAGLAHLLWTVI